VGNSINLGRETFRRHPYGDWEMSSEPPFFPITFNHEAVMEWALLAHALDEIERLRAEVERLMKIVEFSCGTAGDCFWKNYAATPKEGDQ
jgi:hypothetical protein